MPALHRLASRLSRQLRHGAAPRRRRHTPPHSRIGRGPQAVGVGSLVGSIVRTVRGVSTQARRPHGRTP
ncbi:hypothetical protein, partial [Streptomyces chumphonensis]|uniref:hypothetical protein n=1 Tax=Streptomyces chumphonensis TaxID=1214925 RepID=UPI003D71A969